LLVNTTRETPSPADLLRPHIYGDLPVDDWGPEGAGTHGEPWSSFERARRLFHAGQTAEAAQIWLSITLADGYESRHTLQAWHFLRQAGHEPPAERAKLVLGVVAEIPVDGGHDLLAAYRDRTARYLNHAGGAVIWDQPVPEIDSAIDEWLASGQAIANAIGPWDEPALPPLPAGHARAMMLTPSGPHFGQGPGASLFADPVAGAFLSAATKLLQLILGRAGT
jgi:hypothetical protein